MANVNFTIPRAAAIALALDTRDIAATRIDRSGETVTCSEDVARELLTEAKDRASAPRWEWGQPLSWARACRIAAERISAALNTKG